MKWVTNLQSDIIKKVMSLELYDNPRAIQKHLQSFFCRENKDQIGECSEVKAIESNGALQLYEVFKVQRAHRIVHSIMQYQKGEVPDDIEAKLLESSTGFQEFCQQSLLVDNVHSNCQSTIDDSVVCVRRDYQYKAFQFQWFPAWMSSNLSVVEWFEAVRRGYVLHDITSRPLNLSANGDPNCVWFEGGERLLEFSELWKSVSGVSARKGIQLIIESMWSHIFALNTAEDKSRAFFVTAIFFSNFISCQILGFTSTSDEWLTNLCKRCSNIVFNKQKILILEQLGGTFDSAAALASITKEVAVEAACQETDEKCYLFKREESAECWLKKWNDAYLLPILRHALSNALRGEWNPPSLVQVSPEYVLNHCSVISSMYGLDVSFEQTLQQYSGEFCRCMGINESSSLFSECLEKDKSVWVYFWDMPYPAIGAKNFIGGVCSLIVCLPFALRPLCFKGDLEKYSEVVRSLLKRLQLFYSSHYLRLASDNQLA